MALICRSGSTELAEVLPCSRHDLFVVVRGKQVQIETYGVPATSEVVEELKETPDAGNKVYLTSPTPWRRRH
jgi:hypothetical protein